MMKYLFYSPRSRHTIKFLNITDLAPKFQAVIPISSSQSPASGDHYLLQRYINLEDNNAQSESYFRAVISGNQDYFVILVTDSGFTTDMRNKPREVQDCKTLAEVTPTTFKAYFKVLGSMSN